MNIGYVLIALAIAQCVLGIRFVANYRSQATVWYGAFMLGAAVYVGANGLGYLDWLVTQAQAEHLAWTGGAILAVFILPFSYSFPFPKRTVRELLPLVLWPLVIFVPGILFTNAFVLQQAVVNFGNGYTTATGPYFSLFLVFFAGYWLWAILNLVRSYTKADGVHRQQIGIFLVGTVLSVLVATYFDVFTPLTQVTRFGYVGSLCTAIWFGVTGYILLRK